ncbi:MAG: 3-oxoacyl-ACP synthase [Bacteroidota bacterium]|nr:3-oxoacyl-ACP synthase [Bacteroidota bacterium]
MSGQQYQISYWCMIRQNRVVMPGRDWVPNENFLTFTEFIKALYKKEQVSYPKFYKMDNLSKLGFLCAEMIFKNNPVTGRYKSEEIGIILSNSSSSLDTDLDYYKTIKDPSSYFPSPSVFVYTLPNIVTGEICIRNRIKGENAFFISEKFNSELLETYGRLLFESQHMQTLLCGWVEILKEKYEAALFLIEKKKDNETGNEFPEFSARSMNTLYYKINN